MTTPDGDLDEQVDVTVRCRDNPSVGVKFCDRFSLDADSAHYAVEIWAPGLNARVGEVVAWVWDSDLAAFLEEPAAGYRGWDGERSWQTDDRDLAVSAVFRAGGHVGLTWTLRPWPKAAGGVERDDHHVGGGRGADGVHRSRRPALPRQVRGRALRGPEPAKTHWPPAPPGGQTSDVTLHANEIPADETLVRSLLKAQRPEWADLPLSPAGAGTDNTMYRLGDDLLVRLPRTADNGQSLRKEQEWLPRLAPLLPCPIPEPVHAGTPTDAFPLVWSVHRWIDGEEAGPDTVRDWSVFGADLAAVVRELHRIDLMGATRADGLSWYRGGSLVPCDEWVSRCLDECRTIVGSELDVDALEQLWRAGLTLPEPSGPHGWLHGDLKPTNLLVRDGRLHAVIDFGGLSVGFPDAEHATLWDFPPQARQAYRDALDLDEVTWTRARAWAVAVGVSGVSYYWHTFPAFVAECRARLEAILAAAAAR